MQTPFWGAAQYLLWFPLFEGRLFLNSMVKEKQQCNVQVYTQTLFEMAACQSQGLSFKILLPPKPRLLGKLGNILIHKNYLFRSYKLAPKLRYLFPQKLIGWRGRGLLVLTLILYDLIFFPCFVKLSAFKYLLIRVKFHYIIFFLNCFLRRDFQIFLTIEDIDYCITR